MDLNMEKPLDTVSRISIFQSLTLCQLNTVDIEKFECLLGNHYPEFITLCENIKQRDDIESVSCDVESNSIQFKIILVNGKMETM